MKQTTTTEQTFTLIKLGFDKPKHFIEGPTFLDSGFAYTIGELIDVLPEEIIIDGFTHDRVISKNEVLYYSWMFEVYLHIFDKNDELIDNLFEACVKLKEEGVI